MDKNYYAIGYQPPQASYGRAFLYDGVHDFEYWKSAHPNASFTEHWGIRDEFVLRNRLMADRISELGLPVGDVVNFLDGISRTERINQSILANDTWQNIKNITQSSGTIVGFDTETIGDIQRKHKYEIGGRLQSYDGYAGITEMGFSFDEFVNGVSKKSNVTIAMISPDQIQAARQALVTYEGKGIKALNDDQVRMLEWFSKYGQTHHSSYFRTETLDFLGSQKFVTINANALSSGDIYDINAISRGIKNWEAISIGADTSKYVDRAHVLKSTHSYLQSVLESSNQELVIANAQFDITALGYELQSIGEDFDGLAMYGKVADLVYANEAIAEAGGVSVYKAQSATGNQILTANAPASVQASNEAAGRKIIERHIAGLDARDAVDNVLNLNYANGKGYVQTVLEANAVNISNAKKQRDSYYVFTEGSLDKNSMDHAIVNGEETQSYSFRNKYMSVEGGGYALFTPMSQDGIVADAETVYMLTMTDEDGNIVRKQFKTKAEADKWLHNNSMQMPKTDVRRRAGQRQFQTEIADIDLARREYDRLMNPTDIRVKAKKGEIIDVNGFAGMENYLGLVKEIDKAGGIDSVSEESLKKFDIKTDTQKRTLGKLYTRIKSEEEALTQVVDFINSTMGDNANNAQKTMALNKIMSAYRDELRDLGHQSSIRKVNTPILSDALGIDLVLGESTHRINGSNIETIQNGLANIFRNATRDEIKDSFEELYKRKVISSEDFRGIAKLIDAQVPRDSFYNTVFRDAAITLQKVTQPLVDHSRGAISFMANLDSKDLTEAQRISIENKILRSLRDDILQYESTTYAGHKTMSDLAHAKAVMDTGSMRAKSLGIIQGITGAEFIEDATRRNELLYQIGEELGYSAKQQDMLVRMFDARSNRSNNRNGYASYAINGRSGVQSYIIPPSENGSAFLVLTNTAHTNQVNQILSNGVSATTRKDLEQVFDGHASVIELRRLDRKTMGKYSDIGMEGLPLFGDEMTLVTTRQGKSQEKFLLPELDAYEYQGKFHVELREPGDTLLSGFRMSGETILDFVEAGEFDRGTKKAYRTDNKYLDNLSSPSSARAYQTADGLQRAINYNINDLSHAFQISYKGIETMLEHEVQSAIRHDDIINPIYQMVRAVGVASGTITENQVLDYKKVASILSSGEWNEFYIKNLFSGTVASDQTFRDTFGMLPVVGDSLDNYGKNIFDLMTDVAMSDKYKGEFGEHTFSALQDFRKIVPHLSQVLSETNVKKRIASIINPGYLRDLGATDPSMRPTFTQIYNALMFDPDEISQLPRGTTVGPLSQTLIENTMIGNIDITAPSGKAYKSQEHILTTTVKQMSDAQLQLRYREIRDDLSQMATRYGLDEAKLRYTFEKFVAEHPSLYEGKTFGAPMLHNQAPFMSTDVKKVSMPQLTRLEGDARKATEDRLKTYLQEGKILNHGDVIGASGKRSIIWKGPSTYLTSDNFTELMTEGVTTVVPAERMVSDTKWMLGQEKSTVHFTLIDEIFMKKNPIFDSQGEALEYFQRIFDSVTGYDGISGYQPAFIANIDALKSSHNTAISVQSAYYTILNEYAQAGRTQQLANALNRMEDFRDWNFRVNSSGVLVSDQMGRHGVVNAINSLYDIVMSNQWQEYGLDKDINERIIQNVQSMRENRYALVQAQRMNVNEIMGTSVTMDERMQQSIRLRAISDSDTYYKGEYTIDINGKPTTVTAVDGVLHTVNGLVIDGRGRTWQDLYLDELKHDIATGVYDVMDTSKFKNYEGIRELLEDISRDSQAEFAEHRRALKDQQKVIGGLKEAVLFSANEFDVNAHDVVHVQMSDILKRLPARNFDSDDLQELIFKVNGEPSIFLREITGNNVANKSSIYVDFGTVIGGKKGMVIPLLDVNTSGDDVFFNRSQSSIVHFFNLYKESIGEKDGKTKINQALNDLYNSFARELSAFDKDSLLYKTMGKIVLPNSAQSLAQDEIAPLVDALLDNEDIRTSIKREQELRTLIANGNAGAKEIDELDSLLAKRAEAIEKVAQRIEAGDVDESLYRLSGLSMTGTAERGFKNVYDKHGNLVKRYFTNSFETSIENFRDHGVNPGIIGMQLYQDFLEHGKIESYLSNDTFDEFIRNADVVGELRKAGVAVDESNVMKSIDDYIIDIRALNEETVRNAGKRRMADTDALLKISDVFSRVLGEQYLSDVGIMSREVWRFPIFKAQNIGRMYLNRDIRGHQIRANIPATSIITHVDHDGDSYMDSLDLNGGGLKTLSQQKNLIRAYESSLPENNTIMAAILRKGEAFKSDDITDIPLLRLSVLKSFDEDFYTKTMQTWIAGEGLDVAVDDLTEGQIIRASRSSILRKAYEEFDANGNMLTNIDIIKASLTARVRKENIGSISTPNYKFRDTLVRIWKEAGEDSTKNKAYDILRYMTNIHGEGLFDRLEQKSIDVKHIFDAVNLSETPKWVKGSSLLFNRDHNVNLSEKGLRMMMSAVNSSTFKMSQQELDDIVQEVLKGSMESFSRSMNEATDNNIRALEQLKLEFRALYDMTGLPNAFEIQQDIIRSKNPLASKMAEALVRMKDMEITERDSVFGDLAKWYKKTYSDEHLLVESGNVYFRSGDISSIRQNKKGKHIYDIEDGAWILETVEKDSIKLRRVNIDTLEKMDETHKIEGSYRTINKRLREFLNDTNGVGRYEYINIPVVKDATMRSLSEAKFARNVNAILFNTGYGKGTGFDAFENFMKLKNQKRFAFGPNTHQFIGELMMDKATIERARDLIQDFSWAKRHKHITTEMGVHALIKDINENIAKHPERYKRPDGFIKSYDEILEERLLANDLFSSKDVLSQARTLRLTLEGFNDKEYQKKIDFLNKNAYDIINTRQMLKQSYDKLEALGQEISKSGADIPPALADAISKRSATVDGVMTAIGDTNQKLINQTQSDIYALFRSTNQMDAHFNWSTPKPSSIVGFGEYMGISFEKLSRTDIDRILSTDISSLRKSGSVKQVYAMEKTINLLKEYSASPKARIARESAIKHRSFAQEGIDAISAADNLRTQVLEELPKSTRRAAEKATTQKKTIGASITETFSKIPKKAIGITVASMAAIGIVNNLLHNEKKQSPLVPARRPDGNGAPDMTSPAATQMQQAPLSQKRVVYHDSGSGFNFKVSAKTQNYINDVNNAKLIGMSGGGTNPSVYSQADTSGVTDNWLANKFAELT